MKTRNSRRFRHTKVAIGLLMAYGTSCAEELSDAEQLRRPESSVSIGAGYVDGTGERFGEYTGLDDSGAHFIGAIDLNRRDDATATWLRVQGRDLGLDSRDLRVEYEKQGDWRGSVEYSELNRTEPVSFRTSLGGIGTASQIVTPLNGGSDYRPETKREAVRLGFGKELGNGFSVQFRFRNEEKDGSRNFGFYDVGGAPNFLTEPIDHRTDELEAIVAYAGERLHLTGGYLGSFFRNKHRSIALSGALGPDAAFNPHAVSLAPDNEAHTLNLAGRYRISPSTVGTFKVAYTRNTQKDDFSAPSFLGHGSLDGKVDTSLVNLGVSTRPSSKLALSANFRHEDRDDKTPRRQYFEIANRNYTGDGLYASTSRKTTVAKVEGTYRLSQSFSVFGGFEWEGRTRDYPASRSLPWRRSTDEYSTKIGVRRSLTGTVDGSISYVHSERNGSAYQATSSYLFPDFYTFTGPNQNTPYMNPIHWADRNRDKVRAQMNWAPAEALSVQFVAQYAHDSYTAYTGSPYGNDRGRATMFATDATYNVSEDAKLSAWVSRDDSRMEQRTVMGYAASVPLIPWSADLRTVGQAAGVKSEVRLSEKFRLDTELQWGKDRSEFNMQGDGVESLPTITQRHVAFKLSGDYALRRDAGVRLTYVHDRWKSNDWNWSGESIYADGTTASTDPSQRVNFIGVAVYYKWM